MVIEYRATWSGGRIGAGFSVFHLNALGSTDNPTTVNTFQADLRAGFDSIKSLIPNDVTVGFESEAKEIDTATGVLVNVFSVGTTASVVGTNAGAYASNAGIYVNQQTGIVVAGRRLTGRTFLVPLGGAAFNTNGGVVTTAVNLVNTAFAMFRSDSTIYDRVVWSRTHGVASAVISDGASDRPATLRSRND